MTSKELSRLGKFNRALTNLNFLHFRLATIGVFMSFLIQYMASERLPANTLEMNVNHKKGNAIGRYLWFRPTLYSD